MSAFEWFKPPNIADDQHCCEWNGYTLWAVPSGEWCVTEPTKPNGPNRILANWRQTTIAKDLQDAQRRAQAAAMHLHSLREQQRKGHG